MSSFLASADLSLELVRLVYQEIRTSINSYLSAGCDASSLPNDKFGIIGKNKQFGLLFKPSALLVILYHLQASDSAAYNPTLAKRRSQAVYNLLIEKYGVDQNRLELQAIGSDQAVYVKCLEQAYHI